MGLGNRNPPLQQFIYSFIERIQEALDNWMQAVGILKYKLVV
jgi:hypothetical protein